MSLRVWLPLNGTLENKGLDQVIVTNKGAIVDNSGKIGKCYSFDGSDDYISLTGNCLYNIIKGGTNSFSISFWIYQADSTRAIIFGDYGLAGGIGFNIELTTSHCIRFYWNGSPDLGISQINIGTTTWNHVVLVYDTIHLYGYLNGNLVYTYTGTLTVKNKTSGSYYIGRDSRTGSTALNGKMNDFRIYDHALSLMEIKQISQGLILHYPLNNNGWGQENLLINSYGTIIDKRNNTLNSRTEYFAWNVGNSYTNITVSTQVTISFDLEMYINNISSYSGQLRIYNTNNKGPVQIRDVSYFFKDEYSVGDTINKRVYLSTNLIPRDNATQTSNYIEFYTGYGSNNFYKISNVKLELGSKATPWCPNEADELYQKIKINDSIEYDCSGYQKNGEKIGVDYSSDTPKYDVSSVFSASPSVVKIPNQNYAIQGSQNMTISVWAYKEDWSQYSQRIYSCTEGGGFNVQPTSSGYIEWSINVYTNVEKTSHKYATSDPDLYIRIPKTDFSSGWHMFTWVYTTEGTSLYIDGILEKVMTGTSYGLYFHSTAPLILGGEATVNGYTSPYLNGKLSDFRIYCTALSTEDILALYKKSTYIDNEGNLYGTELREV